MATQQTEFILNDTNFRQYPTGTVTMSFRGKKIANLWVRDKDEPGIYISNFFVEEEYRNKGIGSKLINYIFEKFSDHTAVTLHVSVSNKNAIRFYQRHGFFIACTTTDDRYDSITKLTERHYLMARPFFKAGGELREYRLYARNYVQELPIEKLKQISAVLERVEGLYPGIHEDTYDYLTEPFLTLLKFNGVNTDDEIDL